MSASKTAPASNPAKTKTTKKKVTKRKATPRPARKVWDCTRYTDDGGKISNLPPMLSGDAVPENSEFHVGSHKIPAKADFANLATYWRFRAAVMRTKADALHDASNEFAERADKLEKLGTPKQQATAKKLERAMKRAVQMRKEAEAAGIDVAAYMADF